MPAPSVDSMATPGPARPGFELRRKPRNPGDQEAAPQGPPKPTLRIRGPAPWRWPGKSRLPAPPPAAPGSREPGLLPVPFPPPALFPGLPLYWAAQGTNLFEGVSAEPHVAAIAGTWAEGVEAAPAAVPGHGTD